MTRPADGTAAGTNRLQVFLRGFGMVSAVGLGAFAVWLIVTAESVKGTRIGALIGFWALLLAAFAVFGTRHPVPGLDPVQDVVSRPGGEVSRVEDAAARREYEYRLMEMLRREITATMSAELVTLRADVAALRGELVEKVGGQIRLERIETTRVIGSDIEALQHEVRQLMGGRQFEQLGSFSLGSTHTSLVAPPAALMSEPLSPDPVGPKPGPPPAPAPPAPLQPEPIAPQPEPEPIAPEPPIAPKPAPPVPTPPVPTPPTPAPPVPTPPTPTPPVPTPPVPTPPVPAPPVATPPVLSDDPFASMPRLRPFTDFELDPVEPEADDPYAGRRRQNGAASPANGSEAAAPPSSETVEPNGGRHTNANGEAPGSSTPRVGGRRRRAADGDDDVLARILSRETSR